MTPTQKQLENWIYSYVVTHPDYEHQLNLNIHDVRYSLAKYLERAMTSPRNRRRVRRERIAKCVQEVKKWAKWKQRYIITAEAVKTGRFIGEYPCCNTSRKQDKECPIHKTDLRAKLGGQNAK